MAANKIEGTELNAPYYKGNKKCEYCEGEYSVSHVIFEVLLKNGIKVRTCSVCLYEQVLECPHEINTVKNIGEWYVDHAGVEWYSGDNCWGNGLYFTDEWFKHDVSGAGFTLEQLQDREYYDKYISIKEEKETISLIHEDGTEEVFHSDELKPI